MRLCQQCIPKGDLTLHGNLIKLKRNLSGFPVTLAQSRESPHQSPHHKTLSTHGKGPWSFPVHSATRNSLSERKNPVSHRRHGKAHMGKAMCAIIFRKPSSGTSLSSFFLLCRRCACRNGIQRLKDATVHARLTGIEDHAFGHPDAHLAGSEVGHEQHLLADKCGWIRI